MPKDQEGRMGDFYRFFLRHFASVRGIERESLRFGDILARIFEDGVFARLRLNSCFLWHDCKSPREKINRSPAARPQPLKTAMAPSEIAPFFPAADCLLVHRLH
jgi:hypothetical protein